MTTLYSFETGEPVGNFSEATCCLVEDRAPGKFFHFTDEESARLYLVDNVIDISALFKIGGTI